MGERTWSGRSELEFNSRAKLPNNILLTGPTNVAIGNEATCLVGRPVRCPKQGSHVQKIFRHIKIIFIDCLMYIYIITYILFIYRYYIFYLFLCLLQNCLDTFANLYSNHPFKFLEDLRHHFTRNWSPSFPLSPHWFP